MSQSLPHLAIEETYHMDNKCGSSMRSGSDFHFGRKSMVR
jgi:hypothetical protein